MSTMHTNIRKEEFSVAYIHAVAAVAGISTDRPKVDDHSVDLVLTRTTVDQETKIPCTVKLDLQLKCTAMSALKRTKAGFSFPLPLKNYDDLRSDLVSTPRWLIVLEVPDDSANWWELQREPRHVLIRHCAWWTSLTGRPAVKNNTTVSIGIPAANHFTPEALTRKFDEMEKYLKTRLTPCPPRT